MGVEIVDSGVPGLRKLGDSALQQSMNRALAQLPPEDTAAVVDVGVDEQGIQAVAVVRLNKGWSVMAGVDKHFHGDFHGEAHVRWSGR